MRETKRRVRPLAVRLYGWLAGVVPGDLGGAYAAEMSALFEAMYADARCSGRWPALRYAMWSVVQLVVAGWREGRDESGPKRLRYRMGAFAQEIRFSLRALRKRPGFSLPAVLILATGIGATTTIFSVVDTVVLRDLPYPNAGRLVHFDNGSHSFPNFRSWQELAAFESVAAVQSEQVDLTGDGPPDRLPAGYVSPRFFEMLGGAPALGRLLDGDDFRAGSNVVVLGNEAWKARWGGDPDILGRTLRINGEPRLVVGVLEASFTPPEVEVGSRVDLWMPLGDGGKWANEHGYHVLGIVGRLAEGTSLEAAQAQIDAQRAADAEAVPNQYRRRDGTLYLVPLVPLHEATVRRVRSLLYTLLGAVGLLLLIACANVANLFLSRGTSRMREVALRSALGASRWRIAGQVLTEGLVLAIAGGLIGVGIAYGGVAIFHRFIPDGIPRLDRLAVDPRILAFTALASMGTAIVFGSLPALQAARSDVGDVLKDGAAAATTSRRGRRARNGLVVTEIALALVLMTGAGLLFRTFTRMVDVDPGFDTHDLVVLPLGLNDTYRPDQRLQFTHDLLESIRRIPGVTSATAGAILPFTNTGTGRCCWSTRVVGDPAFADEANPARFMIQPVTSDYLATLGARMHAGRDFTPEDAAGGPFVAILNVSAAKTLFGTENAIGRELRMDEETFTVVGIEDDLHHWGLSQPAGNTVYVTYEKYGGGFSRLNVAIRSPVPIETLAPQLREAVWRLEPDLPIGTIETMERRVSGSLATPRFLAMLFGFFAGVSLLLACAGIYSSMLYTVGQRRREMGIRLALGARGGEITRMVLGSGLILAVIGIIIGVATAMSASRFIAAILWNVPPTDPLSYAGAALVLGSTALLACLVPAIKAARADPMRTLRAD